ncbi:MAG TPA: hypothetical protein PLJ21_05690 [Pseudobdellovibrionaceae bacterium]|nr:hypothetical protein [Pseudobdellovibrionaceae bacterium]
MSLEISQIQFEKLWELRNSGQISESYLLYLDLLASISDFSDCTSSQSKLDLLLQTGQSHEMIVEIMLFESALYRNRLENEKADLILSHIDQFISKYKIKASYNYFLQKGLQYFSKSEIQKALENFVMAKKLSKNKKELSISSTNIILCLEDLNLIDSVYQNEWMKSYDSLTNEDKSTWAKNVVFEVEGFKLRQSFRSSNFESLNTNIESSISQKKLGFWSQYFLSYLNHLPYIEFRKSIRVSIDELHSEIFYLNQYRIRTLRGLLIEEDLGTHIKISAHIERLYLWVWYWLEEPSTNLLSKIAKLYQVILKTFDTDQKLIISSDHFQMLENATRWISFLGDQKPSVHKVNYPQSLCHKVFEYERLVLNYLEATRKKSTLSTEYLSLIETHPFHKENANHLKNLLMFDSLKKNSTFFMTLTKSLQHLISPDSSLKDGIKLDFLKKKVVQIQFGVEKKSFNSSLFLLASYFRTRASATKDEVLNVCFGIPSYDSFVHDPKIASLLTQANKLLSPAMTFRTKLNLILCERQDHLIKSFGDTPHVLEAVSFKDQFSRPEPQSNSEIKRSAQLIESKIKLDSFITDWKSRIDYEKEFNLSKSNVIRKITEWKKRNWILVHGQGKASLYKAQKELLTTLTKLKQETLS